MLIAWRRPAPCRASVEPPEKNKTIFKKIFDLSLSDSELDDLSKSFEGYKIASENPQKSTGRIEVVLQKSSHDGSRLYPCGHRAQGEEGMGGPYSQIPNRVQAARPGSAATHGRPLIAICHGGRRCGEGCVRAPQEPLPRLSAQRL